MAKKNEQVAHPELVGGGETTKHTHPGGGNGPTVKAGSLVTDSSGMEHVVFNTAFPDTNYAIALACQMLDDTAIAMFYDKQPGGFWIKTEDDGGKGEPNVPVTWIATPYSNP